MTREIYVVFTMDCERIASESPPGGPDTWELSERAIGGFCSPEIEKPCEFADDMASPGRPRQRVVGEE